MGWEARTFYRYDDTGRLVESWSESEWDEDERDKMLALAYWDAVYRCPVCGGPKSECQGPDAENRFRFDAPLRCHRKTAVLREVERWQKDDRPHPEALIPQIKTGQ